MRLARLLRSRATWRAAHARKAWLRDNETIVANMLEMTPRERAVVMWHAAYRRRSLTVRRPLVCTAPEGRP